MTEATALPVPARHGRGSVAFHGTEKRCRVAAMTNRLPRFGASLMLLLSACAGGSTVPAPETPVAPPVTAPPPQPTEAPAKASALLRPEAGHNLAILASACWFGGIWGDAEGETEDTRTQASDARCHDVVRRVYGRDDDDHYRQLRALEPTVVGDVAAKVETLAKEDADDAPRSQVLATLVQAVAAAEREAMLARRAGARVKRDLDREPDKLTADETAAVDPLKDTRMLEALLKLQAGDLTHDAHALGMLAVLDRVEVARMLPRHLKLFAVGGANQLLFGVPIPEITTDAQKKRRPFWLDYLLDVSKAAGHAVPDTVKTPKKREPLAWGGMLAGYADKMRADIDGLAKDTRLHNVASVVVQRLDAEYKAELNALTGPPSEPPKKGTK